MRPRVWIAARPALGLAVVLGLLGLGPIASHGQDPEPHLTGPQGPYRGRVVELLTEAPLPGALVVMAWEFDPASDGGRSLLALREARTDAAGEFSIDAAAIEAALPPRAFGPRFLVYKPGYVTYPREPGRRIGAPAARLTGRGSTVPLKPVRDAEERAEAFNALVSAVTRWVGATGADLLPEYRQVFREELERFMREAPTPPAPTERAR
jgi:hypothetical protein